MLNINNLKYFIILFIMLFILGCNKNPEVVTAATWDIDSSNLSYAVEVVNVTEGSLYTDIKASGIISGIEEVVVVSETRGIIENINFEIGDEIKKSDILLFVDDNIAKLSMEQAKLQYESAKLELDSIESFYKKGSSSLSELTRVRSSSNGAKALYETALKSYSDTKVKSPINGVIAYKENDITIGNYISPGQKITKIIDLSKIRIEVSIGERQIGFISKGADSKIEIPSLLNVNPIIGQVVAIAGGSDELTGSYTVIIEAENNYKDKIKAGMVTNILINSNFENKEIIIPKDSIVMRDGKNYVFIDDNGIATPIDISIGSQIGNKVSVVKGLVINQKIIISGLSNIKPGVKINSRNIGDSGDLL